MLYETKFHSNPHMSSESQENHILLKFIPKLMNQLKINQTNIPIINTRSHSVRKVIHINNNNF